jgi:hypothetical protein
MSAAVLMPAAMAILCPIGPCVLEMGRGREREIGRVNSSNILSLPEIEDRIAITRDNIRQLIEQAAAYSGAGDEERNADRIAEQQAELDRLILQRDELRRKT